MEPPAGADAKEADRLAALESRVVRLEAREQALREWAVPAVWNALDRLDARAPDRGDPVCLACAHTSAAETFPLHVDACVFGGGRLERRERPLT